LKNIDEIKEILKKNKEEIIRKFKIKEIGIFGSYVRGEQRKQSDVDILVDFTEPIGLEIVDLHEYLEKILGIKVDLVSKGAVIRKQVLWDYIREELIYV
jgi:hypothetical protein